MKDASSSYRAAMICPLSHSRAREVQNDKSELYLTEFLTMLIHMEAETNVGKCKV